MWFTIFSGFLSYFILSFFHYCIDLHAQMHMRVHTYTDTHTIVLTLRLPRGWAYINTNARACLQAHSCTHVQSCSRIIVRAHPRTYAHLHARTYPHTRTHACTLSLAHMHPYLHHAHLHARNLAYMHPSIPAPPYASTLGDSHARSSPVNTRTFVHAHLIACTLTCVYVYICRMSTHTYVLRHTRTYGRFGILTLLEVLCLWNVI